MAINKIKEFLDWQKYPNNMFYIVIPLFLFGFACEAMVAYLHWKLNGDMTYGYIILAGIAVLGIFIWPVRTLMFNKRL